MPVKGGKWTFSISLGRSQSAVCPFNGEIWVVGGSDAWNPLSSVEVYDPATNSWRLGPPMSTPRRGCGLVEKAGLLHVVGGSDGQQSLCTTEVYDPRMNLWTAGPNMTQCRANVAAILVGERIWAVGGFNGKVFLNTLEYLDPERDEWTTFIRAPGSTPKRRDSDGSQASSVGSSKFQVEEVVLVDDVAPALNVNKKANGVTFEEKASSEEDEEEKVSRPESPSCGN